MLLAGLGPVNTAPHPHLSWSNFLPTLTVPTTQPQVHGKMDRIPGAATSYEASRHLVNQEAEERVPWLC